MLQVKPQVLLQLLLITKPLCLVQVVELQQYQEIQLGYCSLEEHQVTSSKLLKQQPIGQGTSCRTLLNLNSQTKFAASVIELGYAG